MRQRKKNTEKDLFLYKGNFIPCLCTVLSLFFCELSYMLWKSLFDEAKGNLLVENLRWEEFGLGTLVSVAFVLPFSTCRCEMGTSSFIIICLFLKRRLNFVSCSLWVVLMFYLSWTEKKRLLKKILQASSTAAGWFCGMWQKHFYSRLDTMKHTKTGFIKTRVIALKCKHLCPQIPG